MDPELEAAPPQTGSLRHKCSACYKQYKKKEHLIEHMKVSYHSVHQPKCGVCRKHCKSLESLREHLTGPLPKANCSSFFAARGCELCLNIFDSPEAVSAHKEVCRLSAPACLGPMKMSPTEFKMETAGLAGANYNGKGPEVIAIDCEMVGGGSDGSLDICGRVCLIDEGENVVLHTYVTPQIPITNYRYEITGITESHLLDAMPLKQVQEKILEILYNGESIWRTRLEGGRAKLLVGHDLEHDLDCLRMCYPEHLLRYGIQSGIHDPYEDCVAAMRLYKRMRDQVHRSEGITSLDGTFDSLRPKELEKMSPDALYEISRSNYRCWCLDKGEH